MDSSTGDKELVAVHSPFSPNGRKGRFANDRIGQHRVRKVVRDAEAGDRLCTCRIGLGAD
ncbi:MAG: hypothetical protein JWO31_1758 [Phycisphaerales bacterium]|nr:hypothetical protein [Phycisphaerales bacterium]